jgi:hypothetical protein
MCRFEVTVANPHLASIRDVPAHISGYSADGAMLICIFDSFGKSLEAGFLFYKDLRSHRGV